MPELWTDDHLNQIACLSQGRPIDGDNFPSRCCASLKAADRRDVVQEHFRHDLSTNKVQLGADGSTPAILPGLAKQHASHDR